MLDAENIRPAFASHNALTVATIVEWAGNTREFEFQRLQGMGDGLYERLVREHDYRCRIYAPVGGPKALPAYLGWRLFEDGAYSSCFQERNTVVWGRWGWVRVERGGRGDIKKKTEK